MVIASMCSSMAAFFTPTVLFCVLNLIVGIIFIASKSNDTKHHDHHVHHDSSTSIARVSSFLERAISVNVSPYTPTTTITTAAAESQHQISSQSTTTAKYSSSSRLAQSILLTSTHVTPPELSNGVEMSQPESDRQTENQPVRAPSLFERVKSIKFPSVYSENTFQTEYEQISNSPAQLDRVPSFFDRVKSFKISSAFSSGAPFTEPENVVANSGHDSWKSEKSSAKKPLVEMKKSRSEMRIASDDEDDVDLRRPATARAARSVVDEEVDAKADDFISRFKQQLKLQRLESLVRYRDMMNRGSWS